MIDMIDNEVDNGMKIDLISEPFPRVLWNFGMVGLGTYTKNPCKLELDLIN